NSEQGLTLVPGSVVLRRDQGSNPQTINLPDTIFTTGVNIGDVRGCFEFHGFVNFKLKVSETAPQPVVPSGTITATSPQVCPPAILGKATITASANVDWEVRVGSPSGSILMSGGANLSNSSETKNPDGSSWATNGMKFYLVQAGTNTEIANTTVNFDTTGCAHVTASGTITATSPGCPPDGTGVVTITVSNPTVPWVVRVGNEGRDNGNNNFMSGGPGGVHTQTTGDWVTDGMTFYLVASNPGTFDQVTVNFTGCPVQPGQGQLQIKKEVRNISQTGSFNDTEVSANPGDTVEYKITLSAQNNSVDNVSVRDSLDSRLTFILGSLRSDTGVLNSGSFFGSGLNMGGISPNNPVTIYFQATVAPESSFTAGTHILPNTATATSGSQSVQDTANVRVVVSAPIVIQQVYALGITKRVQNVTTTSAFSTSVSANPTERVKFEIVVNTAGSDAAQTNVTLRDIINDNRLTFVAGTMRLNNNTVPNESAVFGGSGLSLGTVQANDTRTLTFEADVAGSSSFSAGTTATLTNTANVRSDQVGVREAQAQVIVSVSAVTQDPALSITKRVRNIDDNTSFSTFVTVDPGERVRFEIVVTNTGNAALSNVIVRDNFPSSRLSLTGGDTALVASNGFNAGGMGIGGSRTFILDATAIGNDFASVTNTAFARADQVSEVQAQATVEIRPVTTSPPRDLVINKQVRNLSQNETTFRNSTSVNPGDRLEYRIVIETTGNASQNNVIVRDALPGRLTFDSGDSSLFGAGRNFGTLSAGTSRTVIYQVIVAGASSFSSNTVTTLINTASVRSDEVGTRSDEAFVNVQGPSVPGVSIAQSKSAFNITQNRDATTVAANPGDTIEYTLRFRNTGSGNLTNVVIEDDIRDVLELAQMTNTGGAVVDNNVIRFPVVSVSAGSEITRTFRVTVRAANTFPATADSFMVNFYGNEVRVQVRRPQVAPLVLVTPRTGAGEWFVVALAGLTTAGYWIYRRRKLNRQVPGLAV
ncbi:MAG: hypothetical protein U1C57_00915, partial [Candidatus Doudnabacteria bacterium]|nr:hypothetical protein [Candidatus Doudnabacteria bacterium]